MPPLCLRDGFSLLPSGRIRSHKRKNAAPRLLSSHQTGTHQTMGRVRLRGATPTPDRKAGWGGGAATHTPPNHGVARGGQNLTNPRFKSPGVDVARAQHLVEPPPKNHACFAGLDGVQTCKSVCSWVRRPFPPRDPPQEGSGTAVSPSASGERDQLAAPRRTGPSYWGHPADLRSRPCNGEPRCMLLIEVTERRGFRKD